MDDTTKEICDLLDKLSGKVLGASSDDRLFSESQNWQWPAVNRHILSNIPKNLSIKIKDNYHPSIETLLEEDLDYVSGSITHLKDTVVPHIFNGNGLLAIQAYINTLVSIKSIFDPITGWQTLMDNKSMPTQLARRLRSTQLELDNLTPDKEKLTNSIKVIQDATEAAYGLPIDIENIRQARLKVEKFTTDSAELFGKIGTYNSDGNAAVKSLLEKKAEAEKIVKQCEEAYRITTSTGLAAAFDERAKKSSDAVIIWVVCLVIALVCGTWIGSHRINILSLLINVTDPQWGIVWLNVVLSVLSIGAPLWFAWLSTKQINQRFRLSEDYAFKASVAKAYEGYRREAARIDPLFEARLFSSALTRLEEAPLRFVSDDIHGSPWHELFASKPFQDALATIPEFKDTIIQTLRDKLPNLNKHTLSDIKAAVTEEPEV